MALAAGYWNRGCVLGRGSTATVSLATASSSGEQFAVKSAELGSCSFLLREQKFLSSLAGGRCKNLVSYLGHDTKDGQYNIFLEYAPGGSLHDHIVNRGCELAAEEATVRFYARGVLAGLAYLHSEKVVHCDIKSQNVLIGSDGQAKIADLGCAKSFEEEELQLRGTPMFMAPEVARGEGQGPEADVWAAGCVVVEMASGRAPWPEASADAMAVLHRIAYSGDVPVAPDWMSDEAKDFLSKCLRRDPGRRWTAEQLLRHPFLLNCGTSVPPVCNWISPKSILDQRIWESLGEDDYDATQRMIPELLVVAGSSCPNWTWDEDWLTVRTDDRAAPDEVEQQQTDIHEEDEDDVDQDEDDSVNLASEETVAIKNAVSATATYRTDADNLRSGGLEDCHLLGVVGCYCQTVATWLDLNYAFVYHDQFNNEELMINWIFAPSPVGNPLFVFCILLCSLPRFLWLDPLLTATYLSRIDNLSLRCWLATGNQGTSMGI